MSRRLPLVFLLAGLAASPAAFAQSHAGINTGGCTFATLADALAVAVGGDDIWLEEGHTFVEGGHTITANVDIRTGTSGCLDPGAVVPTDAVIEGNGLLAHLAIAAGADVLMENLTIRGHVDGQGGNLYVLGSLELVDVPVGLGAATEGGGLFVGTGGDAVVGGDDLPSISLNSAANGGGAYVEAGGTLALKGDTVVFANLAVQGGGGIELYGLVTMSDSAAVSLNSSGNNGGGFLVGNGGVLESPIADPCVACAISGNDANLYGGGLYMVDGVVDLANITLADNAAAFGGAAHSSGDLTLHAATMAGNNADIGGAIASHGDLSISDSLLEDNDATTSGGAIQISEGTVDLDMVEISGNSAGTDGGGIALGDASADPITADLAGVFIEDNTAGDDGGGVYVVGDTIVTSLNSRLMRNDATGDGGGLFVDADGTNAPTVHFDGLLEAEGCVNSPIVNPGFDRYCAEIRDNSASNGGGVGVRAGDVTLEHLALWGNTATGQGVAASTVDDDAPSLNLDNVLVSQHPSNVGQAVLRADSNTTFDARFVTVMGNGSGTALKVRPTATAFLGKSIVWSGAVEVVAPNSLTAPCTAFDTVTGAVTGANQTVGVAPSFQAVPRGRFRLGPLSPMLDQCTSGPSDDLDNDPRPVGAYDRGAFERQ